MAKEKSGSALAGLQNRKFKKPSHKLKSLMSKKESGYMAGGGKTKRTYELKELPAYNARKERSGSWYQIRDNKGNLIDMYAHEFKNSGIKNISEVSNKELAEKILEDVKSGKHNPDKVYDDYQAVLSHYGVKQEMGERGYMAGGGMINELTEKESKAIDKKLKEIESKILDDYGLRRINGSFVNAEIEDYDDESIDVEVKVGVEGEYTNTEKLQLDRETLKIVSRSEIQESDEYSNGGHMAKGKKDFAVGEEIIGGKKHYFLYNEETGKRKGIYKSKEEAEKEIEDFAGGGETKENKMKAFLSRFPDDATSWRYATDEVRDLANSAREYLEEVDNIKIEPIDFRSIKTPSEWNTKGKKQIFEAYQKMKPETKEMFYQRWDWWFENEKEKGGYMAKGGPTDTISDYEHSINFYYDSILKKAKKTESDEDYESLKKIYNRDKADHLQVIKLMEQDKWEDAYKMWSRMDTASREQITNNAYELLMQKNNMPSYKSGGGIKNQYNDLVAKPPFGKAKDLWEKWNKTQRIHFIHDHIGSDYDYDVVHQRWDDIDEEHQKELDEIINEHVTMGQYADGGYMAKGGANKFLTSEQEGKLRKNGWKVKPEGAYINLYVHEFENRDDWYRICDEIGLPESESLTLLYFGTKQDYEKGGYMADGGILKQIKPSKQNPFPQKGTYGQPFYIDAKASELVDALGQPSLFGTMDDKVQLEWIFEVNGKIVTLYDYKEDFDITSKAGRNKKIEWHMGGNDKEATQIAREIILEKLGRGIKKPSYEELYEQVYGKKPDFKMAHGGQTAVLSTVHKNDMK